MQANIFHLKDKLINLMFFEMIKLIKSLNNKELFIKYKKHKVMCDFP